jgi:AraC-like DNA-binding protein
MENFQRQFTMALLAYVVQRDLDPSELCKISGIDYKQLGSNISFSIARKNLDDLWKNASERCGDPLFGLHFGESLQLAALGVVGQIIQTSATMSEALTNACSLVKLTSGFFDMQIHHDRKTFTLHLLYDKKDADCYPFLFRHLADCLMVFVIHEMDGLLLEKVKPNSAGFPYYLAEQYEYTRVFRSPKIFRSTDLSLEFSSHYLDVPVLSANYELQQLLLAKMHTLMEANVHGSWKQKVYNYLLANSYLKTLTLEAVAKNFNLTVRGLQRRLGEEKSTYLEIVDEVRKKLTLSYLDNNNFSLKDISHMLGYNEQSAFLRAFRRWTGTTPSAYKTSRTIKKE